jgi:hypothetical protein
MRKEIQARMEKKRDSIAEARGAKGPNGLMRSWSLLVAFLRNFLMRDGDNSLFWTVGAMLGIRLLESMIPERLKITFPENRYAREIDHGLE